MNSPILTKINNFLKNRLIELSGALLIIISVFLLVSIVTYSGGQGNFIYKAENSEIDYANFGGFYDSALADFLLQSIGLIVFLVVLNLFVWGFKLITEKGISNFISKIFSILFFCRISDVAVCYKMFRKEVIDGIDIKSKDFMFDFEFVCKVLKKNIWRISEVNISYKGRTFKEGKKISWIDGFKALLVILKVKLFY